MRFGTGPLQARPSRDFVPAADLLSCTRKKVGKESAPVPSALFEGCPAMLGARGSRRTRFATLRSDSCAKSVADAGFARASGSCASRLLQRRTPQQPKTTAKPESRSPRGISLPPSEPAEERKVLRPCAQRTSLTDSAQLFERSVAKRVLRGASRPEYRREPRCEAKGRADRGRFLCLLSCAHKKVGRPPGRTPGTGLATKQALRTQARSQQET
jgi:hypothetical protein